MPITTKFMANMNNPSSNRGFGNPLHKIRNFTQKLVKCSSCPRSDIVFDDGKELTGAYTCQYCRDKPKVAAMKENSDTNPSNSINPIIHENRTDKKGPDTEEPISKEDSQFEFGKETENA